jgi:hypothetical protein
VPACAGGKGDDDDVSPISRGASGSFVAAQSPACPRADLLSLQPGQTAGSVVNVDLTLTDCDASIQLNGVGFELSFDDTVLDFVGCTAGPLLPSNQLAPGTPECVVSAGGTVLGVAALVLPSGVRVSGGTGVAVRLTFAVTRGGVSSPVAFVSTDSLQGSSVFFADPLSQTAAVVPLGAGGYAGGTFVSN